MTLTLHYHPLASFCHKVLIALYENDIAFSPVVVDLGDERSRNAFAEVWPLLKFPVLVNDETGDVVAESASVIEYLDAFAAPARPMIPAEPREAWRTRMWDRVFDDSLQLPMQKIVLDAIRPADRRDPFGVEQAFGQLVQAYDFLETRVTAGPWALGADFGLADCSAAPALLYADTVSPLGEAHAGLRAYLGRLKARPSVARVFAEAAPYFSMFPLENKPKI